MAMGCYGMPDAMGCQGMPGGEGITFLESCLSHESIDISGKWEDHRKFHVTRIYFTKNHITQLKVCTNKYDRGLELTVLCRNAC